MALYYAPIVMSVVDDINIDCRLEGIHKSLLRGDYIRAYVNIYDTLMHLLKCPFEMDKTLYNEILTEFYKMRVEVALHKYDRVHDRVRNLHHKIMASYIGDSDSDDTIDSLIDEDSNNY